MSSVSGARQGADNRNEQDHHEPTLAPTMDTHNPLEEKATPEEIRQGEYTMVTRLYLDRTPDD
ncbi:hypothetical protein [Paenibacillus xerothermodurans]|uniref:Uncharacterized protein n=1 Tax=Paenibacillus xerothermodurans TaxID=1977292 RepID=A0A2W1NZB5_PAEXE|nr:hypothetical protein [Paenibacillus xerothermodurans]PZE20862.1 hypothetical protein CBW46_011165 [Paenibacillus xerothermodurans]